VPETVKKEITQFYTELFICWQLKSFYL